jgi:TRAP-type C4-dicarboxylate transport system substrate-binding protein
MTILVFTLGMITGAVVLVIGYITWARNEFKKYTKNEIKNFAEKGAEFLNVKLKDDPMQNAMDAWEKYRKENET